MPPVVPVVGLALSAAGTVASISAQSRQAKAQEQSLQEQSRISAERLFQAQRQMEITKQFAGQFRTQQLAIQAQEAQMMRLAYQEDAIRQQQELQAARTQASMQRKQANMAADQLLAQSANENTATQTQNINDSKQLEALLSQLTGATEDSVYGRQGLSSNMQDNLRNRSQMVGVGFVDGVQQNLNTRNRISAINQAGADASAAYLRGAANVGEMYAQRTINNQQRLWTSQNVTGRRLLELQAQRNQLGVEAQYEGSIAEANAFGLAAQMQNRDTQSAIRAQSSQIQRPGILSYLQGAAGIATQAYQLGLFRVGGSSTQQPTQPGAVFTGQTTPNASLDYLLMSQPTSTSKFAELSSSNKFKFIGAN